MDLFAPCRSCLQCLPFFRVSPPSSPQPISAPVEPPSSGSSQDAASLAPGPADPTKKAQEVPTFTAAALDTAPKQDLPTSVKEEEVLNSSTATVESGSDIQSSVISEDEAIPFAEIVVAPPVSSPSTYADVPTHEDAETTKITALPELPLHVPFINDISFSSSGLVPLQSPITPAPFEAGYDYPAGQYHPSPQVYPDSSHDIKKPSDQGDGNLNSHSSEHGHWQHEHEHSHHGHGHSHGHWQHEHDSSHHSHMHAASSDLLAPPTDNSEVDGAGANDEMTNDTLQPPTLEISESMPVCLGMEAKHEGQNGSDNSKDSVPIETYHSESIVQAESPDDVYDDNHTYEEALGQDTAQAGRRRRRRRDHLKDQFKGISQQIKQGGHHFKEEGSKHVRTLMDQVNKQAQQLEQTGSFFNVPRGVNS